MKFDPSIGKSDNAPKYLISIKCGVSSKNDAELTSFMESTGVRDSSKNSSECVEILPKFCETRLPEMFVKDWEKAESIIGNNDVKAILGPKDA